MTRFKFKLIVLFFACVAIQVYGQGVTGSNNEDSLAFSIELEDYVVTAQYRPTDRKNVIHNVEVIGKEIMESRGVVQLDQALTVSPSVRLTYDPILGTRIRMRGISSSNVAVLIDGVPVIGRLDGALDLSQISMQNIERIEIVEGPLSNIYGSNAAGGVINLITKKSQVDVWDVSTDHQWESIGTWNNQLSLGYQSGDFRVSGYGRYFSYDQYPVDSLRIYDRFENVDGSSVTRPRYPWNPKQQYSFGGQVRYNLGPENYLILKYDHNNEDVSDYGAIRRPQFNPYANDAFYGTTRNDLTLLYNGKLSEYFVDLSAGYNRYDRVTEEKRYYLETDEFDPELQTREENSFNAIFSRLNIARIINDKWQVMAGLNYNFESGSGDRITDPENQDSSVADFHEAAIYAEVKFNPIENLQIAASGRFIRHSTYGNNLTPSIQAKYNISDKWSVRAGYAQGYRNPSLKELYLEFIDVNHFIIGNTDLKPEVSHDFQATVDFAPTDDLSFSFNAYRTLIKDRIILSEFETLRFTYDNVDEYDVYGMQLDMNWRLGDFNLQSGASLGYWATGINKGDTPDHGRVFDMNHTASYQWARAGLGFTANYRLSGKQPIYQLVGDDLFVNTVEAIHFLDLSVDRSFFKDRINAVVGVRNLLDTRSANISGQSATGAHIDALSRMVSQGRSVFIKLGLRL